MERKRRGKKVLPPPPPSNRGRGIAQHQRKRRKEKGIGPFSIHEHFPLFFGKKRKGKKEAKSAIGASIFKKKRRGRCKLGGFFLPISLFFSSSHYFVCGKGGRAPHVLNFCVCPGEDGSPWKEGNF